jgi:hypothetical protein
VSRFYRFEGEYVFEFPDDVTEADAWLTTHLADLFMTLAEDHGGTVGGGHAVTPCDVDGRPLEKEDAG